MISQKTRLTVGQVAQRSGVSISTLHFYEQKGLIFSSRNSGNQRQYPRDVLRRVAIIKAAQKVGISLEDIRSAFASISKSPKVFTMQDWQVLAARWQQSLNQKIHYLENLRDSLTDCIGCGCLSIEQCPLRNKDDHLQGRGVGAVLWE